MIQMLLLKAVQCLNTLSNKTLKSALSMLQVQIVPYILKSLRCEGVARQNCARSEEDILRPERYVDNQT